MRYPVGRDKEDFKKNWYVASGFGEFRGSYYHNGVDLNLKSGGDSDLGQPLYAVADGVIKYYHKAKHPSRGYGLHMVLEVETPKGKRWFHYAHCLEITNTVKRVKEGEIIGKLGKSGTKYAHLHFACFKTDPAKLPRGIDTVAKTKTQLLSWWENPLEVIEKSMTSQNTITIESKLYEKLVGKATKWDEVARYFKLNPDTAGKDDVLRKIKELEEKIENLSSVLKTFQKEIENYRKMVALFEKKLETTENKARADLEKVKIDYQKKLKDLEIRMVKDFELKEKQYKDEIFKLKEELKQGVRIEKRGIEIPRDFKRRLILALEILLGVYEK